VVGAGGVGSAIVASLAGAGVGAIGIFDSNDAAVQDSPEDQRALPEIEVATGSKDPDGYDIVVNATPLGHERRRPAALDMDRIAPPRSSARW
jgi:shikimate dehydrogenase